MYKTVIGLEVHCELKSNSKNFSSARNYFSDIPNSTVSVVDLGMPGILPVVNMGAVKNSIKMALAMNCKVPKYLRRAQSANQRNLDEKLRVQNENERYQNRMRKTLDNDELNLLREGLKKKLDSLEKEYGRISHRNKFDTLVSRNYKENLEREMEQVQKDIECISKDIVTVDMTK